MAIIACCLPTLELVYFQPRLRKKTSAMELKFEEVIPLTAYLFLGPFFSLIIQMPKYRVNTVESMSVFHKIIIRGF